MVSQVREQHIFTVSAADGKVHTVYLFPRESCTCPTSSILAAKISIAIETKQRRIINLSQLRTKSRQTNDSSIKALQMHWQMNYKFAYI